MTNSSSLSPAASSSGSRPVAVAGGDGSKADGVSRRVQILQVATELFRQGGYHSTSLDDIANAIGFTKPALYYYFDSKEDILFTIVSTHVDQALAWVRAIAAGQGTASERLHELLQASVRAVLENRDANTVFYDERNAMSPTREADMRQRERAYTKVVRDLYEEGVRSGEFVDRNPTVVTATIMGASIWAYRWYDDAGSLSIDDVAEEIWSLLAKGYLAS